MSHLTIAEAFSSYDRGRVKLLFIFKKLLFITGCFQSMVLLRLAVTSLVGMLMSGGVVAQQLEQTQQALKTIEEFAKSMCGNPDYTGSITTASAGAKAKAEVSKLIKNLADAKVELGAEVKKDSFQGLLQKDLLEATKNATTCRINIFNDLKDRVLPKATALPSQQSAAAKSATSSPTSSRNDSTPNTAKEQRKPSVTKKLLAIPYWPSIVLNDAKDDFIKKNSGELKWGTTVGAQQREYVTLSTRLGNRGAETMVVFKDGRVGAVTTTIGFFSGDYVTLFLREQRGQRRSPGLTRDTYESSCPKLRDETFSALAVTSNLTPKMAAETTEDKTELVENTIKDRPITVRQAVLKNRKATFEANNTFAVVEYSWSDQRLEYAYKRGHPSPGLFYDEEDRSFSCSVVLFTKSL